MSDLPISPFDVSFSNSNKLSDAFKGYKQAAAVSNLNRQDEDVKQKAASSSKIGESQQTSLSKNLNKQQIIPASNSKQQHSGSSKQLSTSSSNSASKLSSPKPSSSHSQQLQSEPSKEQQREEQLALTAKSSSCPIKRPEYDDISSDDDFVKSKSVAAPLALSKKSAAAPSPLALNKNIQPVAMSSTAVAKGITPLTIKPLAAMTKNFPSSAKNDATSSVGGAAESISFGSHQDFDDISEDDIDMEPLVAANQKKQDDQKKRFDDVLGGEKSEEGELTDSEIDKDDDLMDGVATKG